MNRNASKLLLILVLGVMTCLGCSDDEGSGDPQTNAITINPEPNAIDAPWQLAGPGDFSDSGTGDETLEDLAAGDYTITWGAVAGWTTPSPASATQSLTADGELTFTGTYVEEGGDDDVVWPLDLDNYWTYSYEFGGDPESVTLTAGLVQQVAGVDVTVVQYTGSDIFENYFIYLRNDTGGLYFYGDELFGGLLTPDLWCKHPCTVGDEWSTSGQGAVVDWEVIATSESVTVPDGTYDCIHLRGTTEGGGTPADHWFAVGVGEVKMTHGAVLMELTSKHIQ